MSSESAARPTRTVLPIRPRRSLPAVGIRTRLTIWYLASFAVILAALGVYLVFALRDAMVTTSEDTLELTSRAIVRDLTEAGHDSALGKLIAGTGIVGDSGQPEIVGQILGPDGHVIETSGPQAPTNAIVGPDALAIARTEGHWHGPVRIPRRGHDDIVLARPIPDAAGNYLVLAQTLAPAEEASNRLVALLLIASPVALLVAALGGWLLARAALRPVDAMTRTAAGITSEGALQALPVPPQNDELGRLARTLNSMLERLGRALAEERRFTADASHELRTPIALMGAELDVALRSAKTPQSAKPILASVRGEAQRLGRIVENLLVLSRTEAAGRVELVSGACDLGEIASTVAHGFDRFAVERDVAITLSVGTAPVRGDGVLLAQALSNLVDNALKYTEPGGRISISVRQDPTPTIVVADTGRGIPPESVPRIFDRFYRVDAARRRETGGAGLGLEISRRIVEAHGGTIEVSSEVGVGTTFTVRLPAIA